MTVEQYEARLGRTLTGAERAQAEALLADASDVVRRIAQGRLDEATSEDVPGPIRMVIFSMVTRAVRNPAGVRSEEHTSELQSRPHLVCRLLLEKKKTQK